ncbi:MAG: hypothetical protein ACI4SB_08535 [Acutalibacteraceae bacterium]
MAVEYMFDYTSAAPEIMPQSLPKSKPQVKEKPELKKVKRPYVDLKKQTVASHMRAAKFSVLVITVMLSFVVFCTSLSQVRSSRINYNQQLKTLEIYKNDQKQVAARLAKLVSVDKIEEIATQKLGMVKLSEENIIYVDTADKNKIITDELD